jgi:OmpA-OmpF porin, OOP family
MRDRPTWDVSAQDWFLAGHRSFCFPINPLSPWHGACVMALKRHFAPPWEKTMKRITGAALIGAAMLAGSASAQGIDSHSFYLGGHIGEATANDACDDFSGGSGVSCSDRDTSWKILAGYQINRHFAVEAGYVDFGAVEASGPGGTARLRSHAFDLVGLGILPVGNRLSLYGKLGIYHATSDGKVRTVLLNADTSDDATDLTFGFGASFDLTPRFALRGEWQRYTDVGGSDIGKADVDVLSVGALWRF